MSYVSHDGLAYFKHKLDQKFISNISSEDGALKIVLGDGTVLKSIQDTTVTQKKSTANELYPLLLCYDAMANQDQLSKETWFGQHILANPYYGYLASRGMYVKHPTFNRRDGVSQKVEWAYDFTDAVSGLGNPMSQVYAYVDPASEGGEHCIELRLYGNPNVSPTVPSINDSTNTFSIGVGVTGGNVQFGYCPSTPLYLDDGSTLRTEATGHGNDIVTRDWLNLNGSFTGLVHTTMNETIDGAKTFKKTVTINSGDNSNKADLYVQGNSDVHGNEHVYGTDTVDGKLTANGTAEIKGGSGSTPSLTVTGDERVTGNSSVAGNETVSGKITGNNGAEINGGNGLVVNGNETVNGEIYKLINNTPQEYVSYVTNKQETKTTIVNNLIKDKGGLAADANKNIYVNTGKGLAIDTAGKINVDFTQMPVQDVTNIITGMVAPGSGLVADSSTGKLAVDFNQMPTDKFEALLKSLKMLVPLSADLVLYVDINSDGDTLVEGRGTSAKPFKHIQPCINWVVNTYSLGSYSVYIYVRPGTYSEKVFLPQYASSGGSIVLAGSDPNNKPILSLTAEAGDRIVSVDSGKWTIMYFKMIHTVLTPSNTSTPHYSYVLVTGSGSTTNVYGCDFEITYTGEANSLVWLYLIAANRSEIFLQSNALAQTTFKYYKNNANELDVLSSTDGSRITFVRNFQPSFITDIPCQGTATTFAYAGSTSYIGVIGTGNRCVKCVVAPNQTCTGKRYYITTGSNIYAPNVFPGDTDGTLDENTYCWYQQDNV